MPPVTIRQCVPGDLPAVRDLMQQLAEHARPANDFDLPGMARILEEMDGLPRIYLNLVATEGDRVVGFISVIFYRTLFHNGGTALINELVVDRAVRGGGIGSRLVAAAREEALARGMDELEVGTERGNRPARHFYRKCGFTEEYVLLGMEF